MKKLEEEKSTTQSNKLTIPEHIAIIMDGNRRWAKQANLPQTLGHKEGVNALKKIVKYAHKIGVKYLTVYAFSTENWNRKKDEVDFLMKLLSEVIKAETKELIENGVKIKHIGFEEGLPDPLPKELKSLEEKTKNNTGLNLQIAINYGSRLEIINAAKKIANDIKNNDLNPDDINEITFSNYLFTSKIPDPELLIRTGGEIRISNYLLWQCAYSEFYCTETMWPDFNETELDKAIEEFNYRQRRFGI